MGQIANLPGQAGNLPPTLPKVEQFFIVGGDSSRRLPENRHTIGDWSRLLQSCIGELIGLDALPRLSIVRGTGFGSRPYTIQETLP